ncbi:unnamed protein product [Protopolystoma xenopodis]|uniref:Uncharacterized protein n=1 Tax=Protopolystoma xenopodis TaxID=117903 RepID=A0A3S4ZV32_9PLAT|nr:unnamed protein product [Protopolystoma xenopodis]
MPCLIYNVTLTGQFITKLTSPHGGCWRFGYSSDGLLTRLLEPSDTGLANGLDLCSESSSDQNEAGLDLAILAGGDQSAGDLNDLSVPAGGRRSIFGVVSSSNTVSTSGSGGSETDIGLIGLAGLGRTFVYSRESGRLIRVIAGSTGRQLSLVGRNNALAPWWRKASAHAPVVSDKTRRVRVSGQEVHIASGRHSLKVRSLTFQRAYHPSLGSDHPVSSTWTYHLTGDDNVFGSPDHLTRSRRMAQTPRTWLSRNLLVRGVRSPYVQGSPSLVAQTSAEMGDHSILSELDWRYRSTLWTFG